MAMLLAFKKTGMDMMMQSLVCMLLAAMGLPCGLGAKPPLEQLEDIRRAVISNSVTWSISEADLKAKYKYEVDPQITAFRCYDVENFPSAGTNAVFCYDTDSAVLRRLLLGIRKTCSGIELGFHHTGEKGESLLSSYKEVYNEEDSGLLLQALLQMFLYPNQQVKDFMTITEEGGIGWAYKFDEKGNATNKIYRAVTKPLKHPSMRVILGDEGNGAQGAGSGELKMKSGK